MVESGGAVGLRRGDIWKGQRPDWGRGSSERNSSLQVFLPFAAETCPVLLVLDAS